jgi:hypothetical protein
MPTLLLTSQETCVLKQTAPTLSATFLVGYVLKKSANAEVPSNLPGNLRAKPDRGRQRGDFEFRRRPDHLHARQHDIPGSPPPVRLNHWAAVGYCG